MSLAKSFTEEKTALVQSWADQGDSLSDIQKKLASELEVKVTYMELRFLLDDIGVKLKEAEPEPEKDADDTPDAQEVIDSDALPDGDGVNVTISALQRPGALISGTATFGSGDVVEWWLDQMGQLGMNPKSEGFKPNQDQMMAFQQELQRAVQQQGGM